jgi:YjbE family integral membrane protein
VTQIIGVNLLLSADNAVVIALSARALPPRQRKQVIVGGSAAAVTLRIVLTIGALELLKLPYLKLAGAVLLLWIAVKLLLPGDEDARGVPAGATVASAVAAILVADLAMSIDNVLAVAAAAKGDVAALVTGLALSIPLVVLASTLLVTFMKRWPVIITVGAALIGWVAGQLVVDEPMIGAWLDAGAPAIRWTVPLAGALAVVAIGKAFAARRIR